MPNRFLSFVFLLFQIIPSLGQDITRREADSMINALKKSNQDIDRINLFLNLAQFHIFKPGELKNDLDSAADFIGKAKQLNATLKSRENEGRILLDESCLANEYKDRVKGKQLLEEAIHILEKEKNYSLLGNAYLSLADYFSIFNSAELPYRMQAFEYAVSAFNKGGYIEREAFAYRMLAEADSSDVTTEEKLNKSLALYNSIHYRELQGVYDLYAVVYIIRANYPEALKWGLKALKTAETVGDSSMMLCTINNHIAIIYHQSGDSLNAINYYMAAIQTAERYNDKSTVYLLANNIAILYLNRQQPLPARDLLQHIQKKYGLPDKQDAMTLYRFVGDLLRVYTLLKQFQLAEHYCRQLIDIDNENQFIKIDRSDAFVYILDYFLASGQYTRMLPYLKKDEIVAKAYGNPQNLSRLHKLWFCYDTSQHNYQSAINHLLEFNHFYITVNNQARDRSVKELQIKFDTKKKEDEIALLNKQAQLEKANVKQATLVKNMTLAGIIAVLIIAGLLYRQNRLRKKNNIVIVQKNEQLQHFLTEKEWLLKEIHHRVKNNLQIVMSLLNSQSAYIDNEPALTAIHDSQHRVHAMSLIHQKLYNSENVSSIDMSFYIRELVSYLSDSFNTGQRIRFEYDIEPLEMDVSQAVPLGLILNEAITNSIKYAFPNDRVGIIKITLSNTSDNQYLLEISDNGIGIPSHLKNKKIDSLGMSLMEGLSEDLEGSFSIKNSNGTTIKILFVHDSGVKRPDSIAESFVSNKQS